MASYCEYVRSPKAHPIHRWYHDHEHGFPVCDDNALFERLVLEINQAGLSWDVVLRKLEHFRRAYSGFAVDAVAAYGEADRARLLADPGIIRNRLKINAAIENARRIVALRANYGSFKGWLEAHHPLSREEWVKRFRQTFVFTGDEIVNEFLMSTGYLPGAHDEDCPIFARIAALRPAWMRASR
ncbi:MAG: DNA-3-methyladenine glycosylase I [Thermoflexales bacterium]